MNYKFLKWTRVVIALVFFLFTSLIFLDFREVIGEKEIKVITYLQFIPSLLKFLTTLGIAATGFMVILLLTAILGRFYCSSICPLGVLLDIISRAGRKLKRKKRYNYKMPVNYLRYGIFFLTLLTAVTVSILLVNLLDPYSVYGKIANQIFRPVGIWINNEMAVILESMNIYFLYRKDLTPLRVSGFMIALIFLGSVMFLAIHRGRLYCNTICPVGTLLGWISKVSVFRIKLNQSNCTQCGKCSFACKAECINVKEMKVDSSRCVACYNCLTVCEDDAISYSPVSLNNGARKYKSEEEGRRNFIITSFFGIFSFSGIVKSTALTKTNQDPINKKPTTIPVERNFYVCPPGSLSISHFTKVCTACQLCVSQCPTGVLQPSFNQFGMDSIMQPFMDYSSNYCNFECIRCTEICPTGAILSVRPEEKEVLQMGKVQFIKENCVVYTENTACGSCSEHCPTQAVKMIPYKGSLTIPETDNSICVGCGACEHACPVVPYKSIYVNGNPIHLTAEKPEQEELQEPAIEEDFPF